MKRIFVATMVSLASLVAVAQKVDVDASTLPAQEEQPAKMGMRLEMSVRGSVEIANKSVDVTAALRLTPHHALGVGAGKGERYYDAVPADDYHWRFFAYHRYYFPLDRNRRISFVSDIMLGCKYVYKTTVEDPDVDKKGSVHWMWSWQPALSLRFWRNSSIFLGPAFGPSLGLHAGVTLSY